MMPVVAGRRSRLAAPAVLVLVGSLLAVSAPPSAAAGDGRPSNAAVYSACVAAATADAGFTDMDGGHAKAAANCLAHYGITTGTAPNMYSPSASVTRAQMAVFLARAAGPAGVELDAAADQGFTDIGGYSMMFQDAINRVAKAKIMKGTGRTTFSPHAAVRRADMAVFLDAFVSKAVIGPGGLGGVGRYADVKPDDDPFTDISRLPFGTYGSIRKVYELGIAAGTGMERFSPAAPVTRNQMALFITRALAHTNARPAGLSLQADRTMTDTNTVGGFTLHAAHRSADHAPMAKSRLDLFSAASASTAFDREGICNILEAGVIDPAASSTRCVIDTGDRSTDRKGNLVTEVTHAAGYCPGTKRVWTWTGADGARFDADITTTAFTDIGIIKHWRSISVSSTVAEHATHVRFGESVTYTLQLVDGTNGDGSAVAQKDVGITVMFVETASPGSNTRTATQTHRTDASGKVVLTFSHDDPDRGTTGQTVTVALTGTVDAYFRTNVAPEGGGGGRQTTPTKALGTVIWTDAAAAARTLTIAGRSHSYTRASMAGAGARNTVEARLLDQFGDPVVGVDVHFWSTADNHDSDTADDGLGGTSSTINNGNGGVRAPIGQTHLGSADNFGATVRTNSRGLARTSYRRDSDAGWVESIGAVAQIGLRDGAGSPANTETDDVYFMDQDPSTPSWDLLSHYWAGKADNTTTISGDTAVAVNKPAMEIVLRDGSSTSGINWVSYDSNDQFNVTPSSGTTIGTSMRAFESLLMVGDLLTVSVATNPTQGVNRFTRDTVGRPVARTCHD